MRTGENAPPPADWVCDPRDCPLPDCDVCRNREHHGFGTYPVPENIVLGAE